ncbi:glycoside hydrolase [Mycobacterium sp. DBP42]|uniref:coiled-coil domain-containing protein n=1 Tax=Mycobacterium sp. DBP42 TaxID=2545267 RepID=UPI00110CF285|nr:glycoside hydrolase [Mycobacterium sp. DBP42]TMS52371.1 glycoside hydrolase [Mycobacterium sp. DBP42]
MTGARQWVRRAVCGVAVAVLFLTPIGDAKADPAADGLAKLNELSRQAVETREAVTAAQRDVDAKEAEQTAAADRHRADLEALEIANTQLQPLQTAVDRVAAMTYISGRTGQVAAVLTADSPQQLIDQLTVQRAVVDGSADKMEAYRSARERAAAAAGASEKSAADARAAAERASAVRGDLQTKLRELLRQIAAAEAQYGALTPQQQAVVNTAAAVTPGVSADIPESLPVGVASEVGLQPNTIVAARAVSAQFPQISEIGGVRPDSKPWHPSGLAIDIMIPNAGSPEGIALGNEIMAFALSNAARFGLQDVIWRGTYYTPSGPQGSGYGHFDHVHITTTPRH